MMVPSENKGFWPLGDLKPQKNSGQQAQVTVLQCHSGQIHGHLGRARKNAGKIGIRLWRAMRLSTPHGRTYGVPLSGRA